MRLFRRKKKNTLGVHPDDVRVVDLLDHHGVNTIFDIGANVGQYAQRMRLAGFTGKIISFEPISSNVKHIANLASADPKWEIAPRMAIGAEDGHVEINLSQNNDMSSILNIEKATLKALPKGKYVGKEKVAVKTLDTIFDQFATKSDKVFVKVDTQGFELPVIQGSQEMMASGKILGWQLELSLMPLYHNEPTFEEIVTYLKKVGYDTHYIMQGYFSKKINRQLQIDGIFFKA